MNPHSPEFAQLLQHWLDETATAEEAARLWLAVGECPECARQMAAMARFESLLEGTVKNRASVRLAESRLQNVAVKQPRRWLTESGRRALVAAAAVLLLGAAVWSVISGQLAPPQVADAKARRDKANTRVVLPLQDRLSAIGAPHSLSEKSLPDRLDSFFLPRVSLKQVTLREALGLLQGQLLELNHLKADTLEKLRVTVPADAAQRRITFESGPISFLKAVRAVAALGGCDLSVDEVTLALILHREIYPQQPEKRNIRSMLAGRTNADGFAAGEDAQRLAALAADALSLGISGDVLADGALPVTRGQWEALRMLTEAREQRHDLAMPGFLIYLVEEGSNQKDRVLTGSEVDQIRQQNVSPVLEVPPGQIPSFGTGIDKLTSILQIEPEGEVVRITLPPESLRDGPPSDSPNKLAMADNGAVTSIIVLPGQGALMSMHGSTNAGGFISTNLSSGSGLSWGGNQIIIIPQNPPP